MHFKRVVTHDTVLVYTKTLQRTVVTACPASLTLSASTVTATTPPLPDAWYPTNLVNPPADAPTSARSDDSAAIRAVQ
jgi:hypothetical protein